MKPPMPQPADFTCPVCGAAHSQPASACRRCGAALLVFARLAATTRLLREQGRAAEADALRPG